MKKDIMYRIFVAILMTLLLSPGHMSALQSEPDSLYLNIEDAIRVGLERNFGIQIARNEAEIARLNRNYGVAGFTPDLDLTAGIGGGEEDITITEDGNGLFSGTATNEATNLDVALNWTIFDGFKMFTTYKKLQEFENLGQTAARIEIENTVASIISAYYNIIRLEKRLDVLQNTVEISEERFRIADTKRMVGSGSEYEYLLAQADLNSDMAGVLREEVLLNDARVRLLTLLNLDQRIGIKVDTEISLSNSLDFAQVIEGIRNQNAQLSAADSQRRIASLERQEVLRGRMPTIDLTAGYLINNRETEDSIRRLTETEGFRYGATVRVPIFDGFNLNRKLQAAKLFEKNAELTFQDVENQLNGIAVAEYRNYESSKEVVRIEQENLDLVNQTVQIALERFYQGTITSLELRETQRTLINTETRLITAQFDAKISETELLRLMGRLLQQ